MSVNASSKVYTDAVSALQGVVKEGMTLMCGGFGACGIPENLIDALHASGIGNLTVVSNNAGLDGVGL
jgi:3-oxoacid CoA-transferase subunit A